LGGKTQQASNDEHAAQTQRPDKGQSRGAAEAKSTCSARTLRSCDERHRRDDAGRWRDIHAFMMFRQWTGERSAARYRCQTVASP
jgi:hypothetical protein